MLMHNTVIDVQFEMSTLDDLLPKYIYQEELGRNWN
jgi:hypothetical protein